MFSKRFGRRAFYPLAALFAALFISSALLACGGEEVGGENGEQFYSVAGMVSGLEATGLVLQNNGGDDLTVNADGSFVFSTPMANDEEYDVTILSAPADHDCNVENGWGRIDGDHISDIEVNCIVEEEIIADPPHFSVTIDESASSLLVNEGSLAMFVATIENTGEEDGGQEVTFQVSGEDSTSIVQVDLAVGESQDVTFYWQSTEGSVGQYTATVSSENDSDTVSFSVVVPQELAPAHFDVTINEAASTLDVLEGETVVVDVTVENLGEEQGVQNVVLEINGQVRDTLTGVQLAAGASETVALQWTTSAGNAGAFTAEVKSNDDSDTVTGSVSAPAFFSVQIDPVASTLSADAEDSITLVVTIENEGGATATQDVVLEVDGIVRDTIADVELAGGADQTISLQWQTGAGDVGVYTAEAKTDDDSATITVAVNDPQVDSPAYFSVMIDVAASSLSVIEESPVVVVAYVLNLGDESDTQDIELEIDGSVVDTQAGLSLDGGDGQFVTLQWPTVEGDAAVYTAAVKSDQMSDTVTVTVSEPTAILTGTVADVDPSGDLEGVEIVLYEAGTEVVAYSGFAGAGGSYEIVDIEPGNYDLRLQAPGLNPDHDLEEATSGNMIALSLPAGTITQDLTVDWLRQMDFIVDGGVLDFRYNDPDGDIKLDLPECEQQTDGSWLPQPVDPEEDYIEVEYIPDDQCFRINNVEINAATGLLTIDVADVLFPNVILYIDDSDDNFDEMLDSVEVDFEWLIDAAGGFVNYLDGSLDIDIDLRILMGGTVHASFMSLDFGARDGYDDCQLTGSWGGDVTNPQLSGGQFMHEPMQIRLTTGGSGPGSVAGEAYAQGMWLTVDNAVEIGRLSEGPYGNDDPGGASCGDLNLFLNTVDFAEVLNEMLNLPSGPGAVLGEFNLLKP